MQYLMKKKPLVFSFRFVLKSLRSIDGAGTPTFADIHERSKNHVHLSKHTGKKQLETKKHVRRSFNRHSSSKTPWINRNTSSRDQKLVKK